MTADKPPRLTEAELADLRKKHEAVVSVEWANPELHVPALTVALSRALPLLIDEVSEGRPTIAKYEKALVDMANDRLDLLATISRLREALVKVRDTSMVDAEEVRLIEDADLVPFLEAIPDEDLRDELTVARLTGLREAELHRLTIAWVIRDGGRWLIRVPAEGSKTETERFLDLPDAAREILERRAKRIEGHLFPRSRWAGRDVLAEAAAAVGLDRAPSLRDLRTSYGTITLERTGDAAAVMASMGHNDLRTTAIYQRATRERIHRVGDAAAIRPARPQDPGHSEPGKRKATRRKPKRVA